MVEDVNPTDNVQDDADQVNDELEELREEDASVEIDFDQPFQASDEAKPADEQQAADSETVAELAQQIANLKAQLEDRTGQFLRITADFENFRKRTGREKEELETQIKCNTLSTLLEVVDNFERARAQIKPQTDGEITIHKSYQGVYKQLVEAFKRLGVAPMRAEGQMFDPNLHEAVMREPTDEYEEGTVIEELVRGYLLGDRVLRHAMVKVAAPGEPSTAAE
ncbi:MAG: nucleotide exchange factor GrpE [Leptolyngbya sp. SIO4C1]|nr:nucleotide exchange factor GrpE [Leptolyngbya sp. SIO4C1]